MIRKGKTGFDAVLFADILLLLPGNLDLGGRCNACASAPREHDALIECRGVTVAMNRSGEHSSRAGRIWGPRATVGIEVRILRPVRRLGYETGRAEELWIDLSAWCFQMPRARH